MKHRLLHTLLFLLPTALADEAAMTRALSVWEQQMTEFRAAQEFAKTPEQRAQIIPPDGSEMALALWKSISAKTGEVEETVQPTPAEKRKGAKPTTRKVPVYEFEQEWAVPAVAWFICHPDAFVKALENKPRQQAYFSEALLNSVNRVHYRSPRIAPACAKLAEGSTSKAYDILEKIYLHNKDAAARSNAALGMSILLGNPLISGALGKANTRAKRIYYLKQAITLAPEGSMFGDYPFVNVAEELTYTLRYISTDCVPPQIKLRNAEGREVLLPQAHKAYLLFFWSPQDDAGTEAVRHMQEVRERYPDLEICPITPHQDAESWRAMLQQNGISICYMDDEQGSAARSYRLTQLPAALLVNRNSRILYFGAPGLELQTSIDSLFSAPAQQNSPGKGKILIDGKPDTPAIQKPVPTPPQGEQQAPPLRDMPEF